MKKRLAVALALTILMTGVVACDKNSDDERSSRRRDEDTETVDDDRSSKSDEDEVEVTVEETTVETTVETTIEHTIETTVETTVEETEVVEEYTIDDFLSWGLTEGDYYIYNAMTYGEQVSDVSQLEGTWSVEYVYEEIVDPLGGEGIVCSIIRDANNSENFRITYDYLSGMDYPCGLTVTGEFGYYAGDLSHNRIAYIYGDYVALDNVILLVRQ